MSAPEITIQVDRSGNLPIKIKAKSGVLNPVAIDLAGSTVTMRITDALGIELLSIDGQVIAGIVHFALTDEQRASLPAGNTCRYAISRQIGDRREPWPSGPLRITGAPHG